MRTKLKFRSEAPAAVPAHVRVAIYTRKSVEERTDEQFSSIDAQREAVEAYVKSQASLGWVAIPERYDDSGFTGANTNRPAFQRMLKDVEAGRVDVIATYKIDRLSRSLSDFTRLMAEFSSRSVTFVSVTQQFSTTTSVAGTRQGKIVLVQLRDATDPETGQRYTLKRYQSEKMGKNADAWQHAKITLTPTNPAFQAIVLDGADEGQLAVVAELVEVLGSAGAIGDEPR